MQEFLLEQSMNETEAIKDCKLVSHCLCVYESINHPLATMRRAEGSTVEERATRNMEIGMETDTSGDRENLS